MIENDRQAINTDKVVSPEDRKFVAELLSEKKRLPRTYGELRREYPGPTIDYKEAGFGDS